MSAKHCQKLWVFQRIIGLNDVLEWHGRAFASAKLLAIPNELLFGRHMVSECKRQRKIFLISRHSTTALACSQCTGFCRTALETDCHTHTDLVNSLHVNRYALVASLPVSFFALPVVAEIGQLSVLRDLYDMTGIAVFVIPTIALPVVAEIGQLSVLRVCTA